MDLDNLKNKTKGTFENLNLNELQLEGKWDQVVGKAKQTFGILNDDNEQLGKGKVQELIGKIEEKSGKSKKEIVDWLRKI